MNTMTTTPTPTPLIQVGKDSFVNPAALAAAWFYEARGRWFYQLIGETENAIHDVEPEFKSNFESNCLHR